MLLRFTVSNFLSFAEEVEFNMFPSNFKIHKSHVYHTEGGVDLVKAAAIYGANGSGKSNFIRAIDFFFKAVKTGSLSHFESIYFKLNNEYRLKPTVLEIEFVINNRFFIYGFSFFDYWINKEWLYESLPKKNSEILIFEREKQSEKEKNNLNVHKKYAKTEKDKLRFEIYEEELMPAELFLWRVKDRIEEAHITYQWITSSLNVIFPNSEYPLDFGLAENETLRQYFNTFLNTLDTGISKIDMPLLEFSDIKNPVLKKDIERRISNGEKIVSFTYEGKSLIAFKEDDRLIVKKLSIYNRGVNNQLFEIGLKEQSDGSRRILDLIPIVYFLEKEEVTIFIDEIDRSLHPSMVKEFINFLMSRKTKGQLIFTTHESHLLDLEIFRQDEIWFTEKNEEGATKMYPLSDFKPRYDLDIQKGYLGGRFGAIPFLGDLKNLMLTDEAQ